MKKCIKNYIKDYTKYEYNIIKQYLNEFNKFKNIFYTKYYNDITTIFHPYKFELRDIIVNLLKEKQYDYHAARSISRVPAKLQKCALMEALSDLKTYQMNVKYKIHNNINNHNDLSLKEKQYLRQLLSKNQYLHLININKKIPYFDNFEKINQHKLNNYLHRQLKKHKFKKPIAKGNCFYVETDSQTKQQTNNNETFVQLPTPKRRQRIKFKLTNNNIFKGDMKVVLKHNRIELHKAIDIKPRNHEFISECYKKVIINIGFNCVINSEFDKYGYNLNKLNEKYNNKLLHKIYNKYNLYKYNKKIYKNIKFLKMKDKIENELYNFINNAINEFIKNDKPTEVHIVKQNNKINKFIINYINERLKYKCELYNIKLIGYCIIKD